MKPNIGLKIQIPAVKESKVASWSGPNYNVSLKKKLIDKDGKTWNPNESAIILIVLYRFSFYSLDIGFSVFIDYNNPSF